MPKRPPKVSVRIWQGGARSKPPRRWRRRTGWMFVFDTETTIDAGQVLRVGSFRVVGRGELIEEGLFYERLTDAELALLLDYAADHGLICLPMVAFRDFFFHYAYRLGATVVGHNLPFDLSRLAVRWAPGRGAFKGGWSLTIWPRKDGKGENRYRPRIRLKSLNNRAAIIEFSSVRRDERDARRGRRGRFIDTKTLAAALTDRSLTLDQAAETFGTQHRKIGDVDHGRPLTRDYLDYLRRDVLVTQEVCERLLDEFHRHPISLDASQAYSSASIGKAYIEAFGIIPMLERTTLSDEELGLWMSAFFGGRAECRIRGELVPVTYLDVLSMYPTVFTLMALTRFLVAEEIGSEDATEEVRAFLDWVTLDDLFDPKTWLELPALVEVEPDNDILPVRMQYAGEDRSIGVNYFSSEETWWYSLADVIASKILTGKVPALRSVLRLIPRGQLEGLRAVKLRGEVLIDPQEGELFKRVIEERQRVREDPSLSEAEREGLQKFLKTFASASSYGITAELNRQEPAKPVKTMVHSRRSFEVPVDALEKPGRYCFPPLAAIITSAARLVLAMLERTVSDAGGSYVFMDTDSIAIVTDYSRWEGESGRTVLSDRTDALSAAEIARIVGRFASLNPYEFGGSILKVEDENYLPGTTAREPLYARAISAKRYALVNFDAEGGLSVRKFSEHGLGTYRPPTDEDGSVLD